MHFCYTTRNAENIPLLETKHDFFKNSFFPSFVMEWNILDQNIRKVGSFSVFKNNILKFIRPTINNAFNSENRRGIKLITRLRAGLSYLRNRKFKHSFQETLNLICSCGFDAESTSFYVLQCPMIDDERHTLLSTIRNIDCRLLDVVEIVLMHTLMYWFLMQQMNTS